MAVAAGLARPRSSPACATLPIAGPTPRAATQPLRRRVWLRIFVVRCSLPCDPSGWGSSKQWRGRYHASIARSVPTSRSMDDEWPEDLRAVMARARTEGCDYLMLGRDGEIRRNPIFGDFFLFEIGSGAYRAGPPWAERGG